MAKKATQQKKKSPKESSGLLSGVFTAYFILLLHLLLLGMLGGLVIVFRGMVHYMFWIMLIFFLILAFFGIRFYRRMKTEKKNLQEMLALPELNGRSVEVSVLGGFASVRVSSPAMTQEVLPPAETIQMLPPVTGDAPSVSSQVDRLTELAKLYEKNMMTIDEYNRLKERLLNGAEDR